MKKINVDKGPKNIYYESFIFFKKIKPKSQCSKYFSIHLLYNIFFTCFQKTPWNHSLINCKCLTGNIAWTVHAHHINTKMASIFQASCSPSRLTLAQAFDNSLLLSCHTKKLISCWETTLPSCWVKFKCVLIALTMIINLEFHIQNDEKMILKIIILYILSYIY